MPWPSKRAADRARRALLQSGASTPRPPHLHGRLGVAAIGAIVGIVIATAFPAIARADNTYSRYVNTLNASAWYNDGCSYAEDVSGGTRPNDALVVLDVGGQQIQGGVYGTVFPGGGWESNSTSRTDVIEAYASGFASCAEVEGHGYGFAYIVDGVNNDLDAGTNSGLNWAQNIGILNTWLTDNGYQNNVAIWGGSDLEQEFSDQSPAEDWTTSYNANSTVPYIDYGDAGGCPSTGKPPAPPGWACATKTNPDDWYTGAFWTMAWGNQLAEPFPQDYNTIGTNADQWQKISYYAYLYKTAKIAFFGTLSQYDACTHGHGDCSGLDNTPTQAYTFLYNAINNDDYPDTTGSVPRESDFAWGP